MLVMHARVKLKYEQDLQVFNPPAPFQHVCSPVDDRLYYIVMSARKLLHCLCKIEVNFICGAVDLRIVMVLDMTIP